MIEKIDIQDVILLAKKAGEAVMEIYRQDFEVEYKADESPLTMADKLAHSIIEAGLLGLDRKNGTEIPLLSEEGKDIPYEERKGWEYFWLVDPLDGTKEFVKKNDEFTVNIALIYEDTPILGVVYAPALNVCYWAKQGEGAFKDGNKLPLKLAETRQTYKIVASRSHMSEETKVFVDAIETDKEKELISIGSSLKICLVAEGEADIYPRLGPTMEWDTAAAHVVCNEAEKFFLAYEKHEIKPFLYNKKTLLNKSFIVFEEKFKHAS